jgi:hypothetical protein
LSSEFHLELPVSRQRGRNARKQEKIQKSGYHGDRKEKVPAEPRQRKFKVLARKEKTAPGLRTSVLLVRHAECGED